MECLGQQLLGCRVERLGERVGLLGRPGFLALLFWRCADVRALALCLLRPILRLRARLVADQHLLAGALVLALLRLQSLLLWGKLLWGKQSVRHLRQRPLCQRLRLFRLLWGAQSSSPLSALCGPLR